MSLLYGILDLGYVAAENAESATAALLAGGADFLQLRAKGHPPAEIEALAQYFSTITPSATQEKKESR